MGITGAAFGIGLVLLSAYPGRALAQGTPAPTVAAAKPGDIRVICTAAIRLPGDVVAAAQRAVGKPIFVEYGSARGNLKDEILNGQDFEVAVLLPDVNDEIFKAAKILAETHEIGRVPVAFGLRGDAPGLDVSTPDNVKTALLQAKSVKYSPTGAALLTVSKVLSTLDIADKIKNSSTVREEVALGPREYEINIYPISEIVANPKLKNLGAVIAPLQVPSILQAVIGKNNNRDEKASRALIAFLQGPGVDATLKAGSIDKSVVNGTLK